MPSSAALVGLLALTGCASTRADYRPPRHWTPLQVGILPGVQAAEADRDVHGFRLGLPSTRNDDVEGLDLNLGVGFTDGNFRGLQIGLVHAVDGHVDGVQVGLAGLVDRNFDGFQFSAGPNAIGGSMEGIQFGLANLVDGHMHGWQVGPLLNNVDGSVDGVQFGLANLTDDSADGWQLGAYNESGRNSDGLQLGLVNYSRGMDGLQLGLWNVNERGFVRAFPFFNFGW